MTGAYYVARARLSDKAGETLADVGETCDRVPDSSLPWLLESGLIEPFGPVLTADEMRDRVGAITEEDGD